MDHLVSRSTSGDPDRPPVTTRGIMGGVLIWQVVCNGLGALAVIVFLRVLFPVDANQDLYVNPLVFGVYLAMAALVTVPADAELLRRTLHWVGAGTAPSDAQRWWTVAQPVVQSLAAFAVWVGGALLFGVLSEDRLGTRVALGIALAGVCTCTLLELVLSRHFRPVFAVALADAPQPRWGGEILTRVMLAWTLGSALPLLAVGIDLWVTPDEELLASVQRLSVLVITGVVVGGIVMRGAVGTVSGRIEKVTDALALVQNGQLDVKLDITNIGEVGRLQVGFNDMVEGLREHARLEDLFGRQVGVDVSEVDMAQEPGRGESREITALFVDLEGFTAFTENRTPAEVVDELNRFFTVVIDVVDREGGWVHKFEGDAALCIFGAPNEQPDHAARALRVAAALPGSVATLPHAPRVGIGLATGHVVVGNVGTAERYEFTVIGDAVNVAARLTELAKREYNGVLASEETLMAAGAEAGTTWQEAGTVVVRGRSAPTRLFEPTVETVAP